MQIFICKHYKGLGFMEQLKSWFWIIIIEYLVAADGANCSWQTAKY